MSSRELENVFKWTVKTGLWFIPFLPLYVSSSMLFPFITGKNFAFRIIIEIIFSLWVGLAIFKEEYRPRLTPLFKAVTVFIVVLFFADTMSPNSYRAFFSNYERMEGFMMLGHLYLYFVMLCGMFKARRDWTIFFHATLAASILVSYMAVLQKLGYRISTQGGFRVDSTIGNPTYLAAYLLFHLWLLLILLSRFWHVWWSRIVYAALFAFELLILYFTATRGAVLALVSVGVLFSAALIFFWPRVFPAHRSWRSWASAALLLLVLIPVGLWGIRKTEFVSHNLVLSRLTNYSIHEGTIQSRFMIWQMSMRGALERPILGWGQENYYLVFQKYFDPGLWGDEPWFDRSHNIVFDWLIHAGFLGLLSYLSILAVAFWGLYERMKKNRLSLFEGLILGGLFLSYFLQDLFVFDNLNTYLLLFAFFAYSDGGGIESESQNTKKNRPRFSAGAFGMSFLLLGVALVFVYFLNIQPILEARTLIQAMRLYNMGAPLGQVQAAFQKALSYRTFGDAEVDEQLSSIARDVATNSRYSPEERKQFVAFAVGELDREFMGPAKDVKNLLFLGSILDRSLPLDPSYNAKAEEVLLEAVRLSPTKQIVLAELAQLYLFRNDLPHAIEVLKRAWELDTHYKEAAGNLWVISILGKRADIIASIEKTTTLEELDQNSLYRISLASERVQDFSTALRVYDRLVTIDPKSARYRAAHAALLANFGRIAEARAEAEEAKRLEPQNMDLQKQVDEFLQKLPRK